MTPVPVIAIAGVFGLLVGSFFNVCISRIPAGESIVFPGSRCPKCRTTIRWFDNVPVLSFLRLRGRCRSCGAAISPRYPIVEAGTAIAFAVQAMAFGSDPALLAQRLVLTALLIVLFGTDLETQRLPNVLTIPGTLIGVLFSIWLPPGLLGSAIGAAFGAGILLAVRWLWLRVTGVDAMGLGDVKMLAMIGAFLGWQQVWVVLFVASVGGAILGVGLAVLGGRSMKSRLPFGTLLALAALASSLVGDQVLSWYLGFYR
jgi:leader peptidase (prepilin peptidase) / N-methyltransferase